MKTTSKRFLSALALMAIMVYGCSKTGDYDNPVNPQNGSALEFTPHVYGVLPTTSDMVTGIPVFSKESITARADLPINLKLDTPPVRDQGQIGSCTAFCGAETDEILYYYKNNKTWTSTLSPAFIYYCERVLILRQRIQADNGASMVNIPQALQKYGDCLETSYPYPSSNKSTAYKTAPKAAATTEALKYRIGQLSTSYAIVKSGDVAAVKSLIASNTPVMMGFNVYDNASYSIFEKLNTTNYTYNPLNSSGSLLQGVKLLGAHATPIVGYDDTQVGGAGAFLVMNSWGTSWGNAGFFWMPYTVFKSTRIVPLNNCYYATLN